MKRGPRFSFIFLPLVALGAAVGSAFASWHFYGETFIETTPEVNVDDIKENWYFGRDDLTQYEEYTIYFFPQPRVAYSGDQNAPLSVEGWNPLERYTTTDEPNASFSNGTGDYPVNIVHYGRYGQFDGFFADESQEISRFGYKTWNGIYQITPSELNAIGSPSCLMRDGGGYNESTGEQGFAGSFIGWSYSREVACHHGYHWQGDYHLFNPNMPLSYYDNLSGVDSGQGVDGSKQGDNVIYLYAIYTSGKDYAKYDSSADPRLYNNQDLSGNGRFHSIRLDRSNNSDSLYGSAETFTYQNSQGIEETNYIYSFRNVQINSLEDTLNISVGAVTDKGWDGAWSLENLAIDRNGTASGSGFYPGYYNIFAYVVSQREEIPDYVSSSDRSWDWTHYEYEPNNEDWNVPYNQEISEAQDFLEAFSSGKSVVYSNNYQALSSWTFNGESDAYDYENGRQYPGTYGGLFDGYHRVYNASIYFVVEQMFDFRFIGGPLESFDYNNSDYSFLLETEQDFTNFERDIYFEATTHNRYFAYDWTDPTSGTSYTNYFCYDVFSIAPSLEPPTYEINIDSSSTEYIGKLSDLSEEEVNQHVRIDENLSSERDEILSTLIYLKGAPGYYRFNLKVEYDPDYSLGGASSSPIKSVTIGATPLLHNCFIKIYRPNNQNLYYDENGFIVHEGTNPDFVSECAIGTNFDEINFSNQSFRTLLTQWNQEGLYLVDHLTNEVVTPEYLSTKTVDKNYIFYLKEAQ